MSVDNAPNDPRKFTLIAIISFVTVFVFLMIMMLWHGDVEHSDHGHGAEYKTKVINP